MNAGVHIIPAKPEEVFRREENDDLAMYLMRSPATDISESFDIFREDFRASYMRTITYKLK